MKSIHLSKHYGESKEFGQAQRSFFIDGDEREFKAEEGMINAVMEGCHVRRTMHNKNMYKM